MPFCLPINGYESYVVCQNGDVIRADSGYIMKPHIDKKGYKRIKLFANGKHSQAFLLHRVIATAFIKNDNRHPIVDHVDRNKLNNTVSNLRWVSYKESAANCGGHKKRRKSLYKGVYPSGKKWAAMSYGKYLGVFSTQEDAARAYDIHTSRVAPHTAYLNRV